MWSLYAEGVEKDMLAGLGDWGCTISRFCLYTAMPLLHYSWIIEGLQYLLFPTKPSLIDTNEMEKIRIPDDVLWKINVFHGWCSYK